MNIVALPISPTDPPTAANVREDAFMDFQGQAAVRQKMIAGFYLMQRVRRWMAEVLTNIVEMEIK